MRSSTLFFAVCLSLAGCSPNKPPGGPPSGTGLGGSCKDATCRLGLKCDDASKLCVGASDVPDGKDCSLGAECVSGHCAPNGYRGKCAPAGTGLAGSSCAGDAACAKGLKCAFDGQTLFPSCLKPGNNDQGAACVASRECTQGLMCEGGYCGLVPLAPDLAPNGYPPFIPAFDAWKGGACPPVPASPAVVKALWELPRASDPESVKQDFYRLPYPNDAARDALGKVDYSRHPRDPAPPFGFDALGRYLDALALEPFGNFGTVTLRFDGQFDFNTVKPQTRFVDLTTGPRFGSGRGWYYIVNSDRTRYICHNYLSLRSGTPDILLPGTYGLVLLKGVKAKNGTDVEPSPDFVAMLQSTAPADPALARAWAAYAPLRAYLTQQSIAPAAVLTATVFTVADPQALVKKVAASVAADVAPVAGPWVKCGSATPSPCPDATGARACGASAAFDEWHTLVEVPIFQSGTAPYLTPAEGGSIDAGQPLIAPVRREKVCAALVVPAGTPPATGWPLVLYGHGTGGSYRSHAADGAGAAAAGAMLPNVAGSVGFALLGFDAVGHGPRRGARQEVPPDQIVYNLANPASARGIHAQGAADLHSFARLAKAIAAATPAGLPKLNATNLAFWGHSQGATAGALFLATNRTVVGALFTGASASLTDALLTKKAPINISGGLWMALSEASPAAVDGLHPVLSMLQNWSDPVDPVHFARHVPVVPVEGATPAWGRHVFQVWGRDDLYTARAVQSAFAVAAGLRFVGPQNDAFDAWAPVASASGNLTSPRPLTAAFRQYVPGGMYDGHFVVFQEATATKDAVRFLARVVRGELPTIPEP